MARGDIRQKISLDGGEEVKRQLAQMGKSGEDAIQAMDRAVNLANADLGRFAATVAAARASIATMHASFATAGERIGALNGSMRNFGAAMQTSAGAILPFNTNILAMIAAVTAALAPLALFSQAKKAALATDSLVDTAENLKITTEELVALRQVSKASGAEFDVLENAIQKGNRTLGEAASKTKGFQTAVEGGITVLNNNTGAVNQFSDAVEVLRGGQKDLTDVTNEYAVIAKLAGTTIQSLAKMNPVDRFLLEAKAIGRVKDETEQARLANAAFGKTYKDLLPIMRDATTDLKPTIANVKLLEQGVSKAEKEMSEAFLVTLARTETALGSLGRSLGGTLGTVLVPVIQEIDFSIMNWRKDMESLARTIAARVMPVVKDFVALVRGDELKTDFVKGLVSAFTQAKDGATIAFTVIKAGFLVVAQVLEPVAAAINAVFGTEFSGKAVAIGAAVFYVVGGFTILAAGIAVVKAALLLAFGAPMVALIAAIAVGISLIDFEALKSGKTLETLKGTLQGMDDIMASLGGVMGRWFTTNIIEPAGLAIDAIQRVIDKWVFLQTLGFAGKWVDAPTATAKIPLPPVAEQFDAHVKSLKDTTASAASTIANAAAGVVVEATQKMATAVDGAAKRAKVSFEELRKSDSQLQVGGTFPETSASQNNASIDALKAATAANTQTLQNTVTAQTGSLKDSVDKGVNVIRGGVAAMGAGLTDSVDKGVNVIRGLGTTDAVNAHISAFTKALQEENALIKQSVALITGLQVAANDALRAGTAAVFNGQGVGGGGSNILPMAAGGLIRGPGTGTSDSVPLWGSAGEFISTARAVQFWGADVFAALNRLQNPFKGFSLGGLVEGMGRSLMPRTPRFAGGGLVAAGAGMGAPVHLHFPDGSSFGPMMTDAKIAEAVIRYGRGKGMLSAMRKPSSYA